MLLCILYLGILTLGHAHTSAQPLLFSCNASDESAHTLEVDTQGGYQVTFPTFPSLNLYNGSVSVHQSGTWYSTLTGTLHLGATSTGDGTDALLGAFTSATLSYTATGAQPPLSITALFRCYAAGPLVFELAYPAGALNVSTESSGQPGGYPKLVGGPEFNASLLPSSYFPAFAAAPLRTPANGYIEWNGRFTNDASQYGTGLSGFVGGATGGPLVMYDPLGANATAFVLGTFDNFKSTMLALVEGPSSGPPPPPPLPPTTCSAIQSGMDVTSSRQACTPAGINAPTLDACCAACCADPCCETFVYDPVGLMPPAPGENCWTLRGVGGFKPSPNRTVGTARPPTPPSHQLLVGGVGGKIINIPLGFTTKVALVSSLQGVTHTVYAFGGALQMAYNTSARRPPASLSPLSSSLSYWTDNGAFFSCAYWGKWAAGDATATDILRELKAWHTAAGFPFRTYQLDPWWYIHSDNATDCGLASNWSAVPQLFPQGLPITLPATSSSSSSLSPPPILPLTLYMNYFAPVAQGNVMTQYPWVDSVYIDVGWFVGVISQVSPSSSLAFFTDIMRKGLAWGMKSFEVDFLDFTALLIPAFTTDAMAYTQWITGMAEAAESVGVSVQLCMDLPSDALLSTQLPYLNNARASEDDFPGADSRWDISLSSLLYGAVGLRPFYDDTWSVPLQPGNPYGPDSTAGFVEVSVVISALSTGGVGLSDGLALGNTSLALMACGADGTLLQPSRPATPIDATFAAAAAGGGGGGVVPSGKVWQAPSFVAGTGPAPGAPWWVTVLGIDVVSPFPLLPTHLSPPITGAYVALPWAAGTAALAATCRDGAPASPCLLPFSPTQPITILTGGEGKDTSKPHDLWSLAPVLPNGYALVGEIGKVVRVSLQRFLGVVGDAGGYATPNLVLTIQGFPWSAEEGAGRPEGVPEVVTVTVLAPGGVMRSVDITFFPTNASSSSLIGGGSGSSASVATVVCTGAGVDSKCSILSS